jgi:hypothetical protein
MSTKILGNSAASSYWTGFPEDVQSLDRFTRMAPLPATPSKRGLGGPSSKERFGSATERPSSSFRLTLRLVEGFASHPPQRTRKDGAPSWLAEARLPAPVGRLVNFSLGAKPSRPFLFECWGVFSCAVPPSPAFAPGAVDGGQTRDYYRVLPSGLQAICLRAVILDRSERIGVTCRLCERACPVVVRRRKAGDPDSMLDLEGI